jgi:hypothetical protein
VDAIQAQFPKTNRGAFDSQLAILLTKEYTVSATYLLVVQQQALVAGVEVCGPHDGVVWAQAACAHEAKALVDQCGQSTVTAIETPAVNSQKRQCRI